MSGEQRMCRYRNAVKQGQDRVAQLAGRRGGAGVCGILDLDCRRQALRADVHDRLKTSDTAFCPIDDFLDRPYRQIHQQGMICDVGQPSTREDLPAACSQRRAHFIFPGLSLCFGGPVNQLDLQRHKLVLAASLNLLGKETGVKSLNSVLRPPGSQITQQFEHATPWRLSELKLIGVPALPKGEQFGFLIGYVFYTLDGQPSGRLSGEYILDLADKPTWRVVGDGVYALKGLETIGYLTEERNDDLYRD